MAEFIVRNSLNPNKVILCGITYRQVVPKNNEGDSIWLLEVTTDESDINGDPILPEFINLTTSDTLDEEVAAAVSRISAQVDWSPLLGDTSSPYVYSATPSGDGVYLGSSVQIILRDSLPSAGIDLSSIIITVNDFDVTTELDVTGDPYEYEIKWSPYIRVTEEY